MIFLIITIIILFFMPKIRCILLHFGSFIKYTYLDIYRYIKFKKWKDFNEYGIDVFIGIFGKGKTLSAVHKALKLKARYPYIDLYSNIKLNGVEYIPLKSHMQIINSSNDAVFIIDEASTLFNSRQWKDFNHGLFSTLCQCRKKGKRKYVLLTAQRWGHLDKSLRDISRIVYDCDNLLRIQDNVGFDAYDYENCEDKKVVKIVSRETFIRKDSLYNSYDTDELVTQLSKTDYIDNETIINMQQTERANDKIRHFKMFGKKKLKK